MRLLPLRPIFALALSVIWFGWAAWANLPHYYDAEALQRQIREVLGPDATAVLQPSVAGFPFGYMKYGYTKNGSLNVYSTTHEYIPLNVLLCVAGVLSVILVVARAGKDSRWTWALLPVLLAPAVVLYFRLGGPHPAITTYIFFVPLVWLLVSLKTECITTSDRPNDGLSQRFGTVAFQNEDASVSGAVRNQSASPDAAVSAHAVDTVGNAHHLPQGILVACVALGTAAAFCLATLYAMSQPLAWRTEWLFVTAVAAGATLGLAFGYVVDSTVRSDHARRRWRAGAWTVSAFAIVVYLLLVPVLQFPH